LEIKEILSIPRGDTIRSDEGREYKDTRRNKDKHCSVKRICQNSHRRKPNTNMRNTNIRKTWVKLDEPDYKIANKVT
jgi:hypothetical protein